MKTNYWTTKDGQQIAVEDLGDEHLLNILNMLKNNNPKTFFGMRISRINTSSYSIDKNREQLNLILGESKYISCPRQELKDKMLDPYHNPFQGEIASEQWDYHMLGGYDYDEINDPYCFDLY
jgi:hypothetical protein